MPVYFGILPELEPKALADAVYRQSALAGVGHTQLHLGSGLVVFRSVVERPRTGNE